ncbi:hypothetical protein [Kangiella shandongensis]|uniref:hypothetical protein n=1 Tax=Kangiella shandongensis TaxID=2763258 RepID=UPI001CBF0574|nr:hypothetical protein [Kangiella shandongensis]
MKILKTALLTATALGLTSAAIQATAGQGCVTCGGYFYTAYSYSNTNGMADYTYADRGPYSTEEECQQAVQVDYGNSDGWLPYSGAPKCVWRYESDYEVYEDIIDDWNSGINGDDTNTGGAIGDKEVIAKIKDLRKTYNVDKFELEVHRVIESTITDPNYDEDEDGEVGVEKEVDASQ